MVEGGGRGGVPLTAGQEWLLSDTPPWAQATFLEPSLTVSHGHSPYKRKAFSGHDGRDPGSTCRDSSVIGPLFHQELVVSHGRHDLAEVLG